MKSSPNRSTLLGASIAILGICIPWAAISQVTPTDDDLFLLTTSIAPNVVLFFDNSISMRQIEWHPAFDSSVDPTDCGFDNDTTYDTNSLGATEVHCGNTRTIFAPETPTLWSGRYLNWYFSDDATPYIAEIETAVAETAGCSASGGSAQFANMYRRTRTQASKQVLLDLLCRAEPKGIRFALSEFRIPANSDAAATGDDPNGGFVSVGIQRANPNHAAELESALKNTNNVAAGPLGELLFQIYSYYMSRDSADLPLGVDAATSFPRYEFSKDGDWESNSNMWLDDPVEYSCQKSFVVIVTDGQPSRDDFDADPSDTAMGFSDFANLIGDYNADGETEVPGDADETAWYLDDIAKYMQENDFRPDFGGDQVIDTYTIGFATDATTDAFLRKTAEVGNGLFFHVKDGDQLSIAMVDTLNDIIEKAQSFTAASVPSTRTVDGGDFYQSYFFPSGSSAFWEGHVRAWHMNADGDVLDANDVCALEDPDAGECNSGPFKASAVYFWDAAEEVPAPTSRTLYVSTPSATSGALPPTFDAGLTAADLDIIPFAAPSDPSPNSGLYPTKGSTAINEEGLADEVVAFARGCFFGTGVPAPSTDVSTPSDCTERPSTLGDIFHSNPIVVREPRAYLPDPSYRTGFQSHYGHRKRAIYTGTNAGFLEAIDAGSWTTSPAPAHYNAGTGAEVFGFMPWQPRKNIKNFPIDSPTNRTHYVDGSPQVADVWRYPNAAATSKASNGSEWRTVLVSGLRQGGSQYYALDITNPDGIAPPGGGSPLPYPGYLWEFPCEDSACDADRPYMGETWGQPVITRIKVENDSDATADVFERWVAIVTGGYDETGDPNPVEVSGLASATYVSGSTQGHSIFVIDIKTGQVLAEKKYDAGASDAQADMLYAIPSSPAVFDLNSDGFADVIYVGDLGGQVFKWVINPVGKDRVNDGSGLRTQPSWTFKKFFAAPSLTFSSVTYYKNFYFPPSGVIDGGKLWIAFGSGERSHLSFEGVSNKDENNRFYAVTDLDPYELLSPGYSTLDESDLADASSSPGGVTLTTERGYYFKIRDGEKFVTHTTIFAGQVIAASFTPTTSTDRCASRGDATLYIFDVTNGAGYFRDGSNNPTRFEAIGVGLPTDPKTSVGVGGADNRVYIEKSGADLESMGVSDLNVGGKVLYWREVR